MTWCNMDLSRRMQKIAKGVVTSLKPKLLTPAYEDYSIKMVFVVKCTDLQRRGKTHQVFCLSCVVSIKV